PQRHPPPGRPHADGAVAGQDGAVAPPVEADAHLAFLLADELLGLLARHRREVVDRLLALRTVAHALGAAHVVPGGVARAGDLDRFERDGATGHGSSLAADVAYLDETSQGAEEFSETAESARALLGRLL